LQYLPSYLVLMPVGSSDYGASQWKGLSDIILLGVVCIGEFFRYISPGSKLIVLYFTFFRVAVCIHFIRIGIQHFRLNTDSDQGF
jgi:hypothetical protein